jgi:hypothetical protein
MKITNVSVTEMGTQIICSHAYCFDTSDGVKKRHHIIAKWLREEVEGLGELVQVNCRNLESQFSFRKPDDI